KHSMTLEHLLTMTAGLDCRDTRPYRWAGLSTMFESSNWTRYALGLPTKTSPGRRFEYCNAASFLLAAILEKATHTSAIDFARKNLFDPMGIRDVSWSTSPQGIAAGFGYLWMTPHDMAKFGWLYLNKGRWDGRQLLSTEWVDRSTRAHVKATKFPHYGYQWWRDSDGYLLANGARGQYIYIVPEHRLVAVFTADLEPRDTLTPKLLLNGHVIASIRSDAPLPANPEERARVEALVAGFASAPEGGFVWTTPENGTAKNGRFVHRARPTFQVNYPVGSRKQSTFGTTEVMRMKSPSDVTFSARVLDIPTGVKLSEAGPTAYVRFLRESGEDIQVRSNHGISLRDDTRAYLTTIRWKYNGIRLTTVVVSAYRDNKWIAITAHAFKDPEDASAIVESLTFRIAENQSDIR
ncbi:MAG: serine hydrolase, partial [Chromatiales bacterium]|nr:serine hydrolase [Chromatiales bacterium]